MEKRVTIDGYPNYRISNIGQIWNAKFNRTIKLTINAKGYSVVYLYNKGKRKNFFVHRLVYESFVGTIPDNYQINHKDEDKSNNAVANLELLTSKQNCNYGTRNKRLSDRQKVLKGKVVIQSSLDGSLIRRWQTLAEVHENGFNRSIVCRCCKGRIQTHRGYRWSYET